MNAFHGKSTPIPCRYMIRKAAWYLSPRSFGSSFMLEDSVRDMYGISERRRLNAGRMRSCVVSVSSVVAAARRVLAAWPAETPAVA